MEIEEIRKGIDEADRGDFASDEEGRQSLNRLRKKSQG
jgi:predicted transcriptional regulator